MAATYTKPTKIPRWADTSLNVTEPSSGKKDTGWLVNEIPPSSYENWRTRTLGEWFKWIDERIFDADAGDSISIKSPGVAEQRILVKDDTTYFFGTDSTGASSGGDGGDFTGGDNTSTGNGGIGVDGSGGSAVSGDGGDGGRFAGGGSSTGAGGRGILASGGSASGGTDDGGVGLYGAGGNTSGGIGGIGVYGLGGGSPGGTGGKFVGGSFNGDGVYGVGNGTGSGGKFEGGSSSGDGLKSYGADSLTSSGGRGVYAEGGDVTSGAGVGGVGGYFLGGDTVAGSGAYGVYGRGGAATTSGDGGVGGYFLGGSSTAATGGRGGYFLGGSPNGDGLYAKSNGTGRGIVGENTGSGDAVRGQSYSAGIAVHGYVDPTSGSGYGIVAEGKTDPSSSGRASFRIVPQTTGDPATKDDGAIWIRDNFDLIKMYLDGNTIEMSPHRAWCSMHTVSGGGTPTVDKQHNIASISVTGTRIRFNFSNSFNDTNYIVNALPGGITGDQASGDTCTVWTKTTGYVEILVWDESVGAALDPATKEISIDMSIIGRLA